MRFRTRNAKLTKAALLRAGADAFAQHGFAGAALEGISDAAGVNKAMVGYYFGGKAGLFQAILEEAVDYILARVANEVDSLDQPDAQLAAYIRALGEMMSERPFFPAMVLRDYQAGRFQQDPALVQRLMQFSQITHRILSEGEALGEFRRVDHHMMHLTIVGSLAYFVSSQRFRDEVGTLPVLAEVPAAMPQLDGFIQHVTQTVLFSLKP